jgi:hypothetical protein
MRRIDGNGKKRMSESVMIRGATQDRSATKKGVGYRQKKYIDPSNVTRHTNTSTNVASHAHLLTSV